jgi:TatD DNase family protein
MELNRIIKIFFTQIKNKQLNLHMNLTDTHLHLYSEEFGTEVPELISRAIEKGVNKFVLPNIDLESIDPLKVLVNHYSENCFGMMGLHPCYVKEDYRAVLEAIKKELYTGKYVAVGEIGTDLYWDKTTYQWQAEAFMEQCKWAIDLNLPIAIHCRESVQETIDLVKEVNASYSKKLRGVFHCFSGNFNQALEIIDLDFYIGIGGVITFKNGKIDQFIKQIPISRIVLETDGPYLAPVPYRGKRNNPEYLIHVAQKLADLYEMSLESLAKITTDNAAHLFNIKNA